MADYIVELLASFCAVVIVLTLHEFAHALVAYKCGDPTPKWEGRLSLNPLRHYDLWGLLCFTFVGFGWAKPVSVNAYNFRNYRAGLILTACAGVVANFILAFLVYPLYYNFMSKEAILNAYQAILPAMKSVEQSIIVFNMPFTFLKAMLSVLVTFLIYKRISPIIKGVHK